MKLIFSTTYDQEVLIKNLSPNTKYIGPLGLLNILERELGLYKIYKNEKERITLYLTCLKENKKEAFYEKALLSDELKVAKQLLTYRDELILMGWESASKDQPTRLNDLHNVEKSFRKVVKGYEYEGVSDRWRNVVYNLTQDKIKEFNGLSIVVVDDEKELPNYLQLAFNKMDAIVSYKSAPVVVEQPSSNLEYFKNQLYKSIYNPSEKKKIVNSFNDLSDDKTLQILNFKNVQLLMDCMAAYANENTVFINQENSNFDYSLVSLGKSAAGSKQIQANPQVIQIVKLIIPCFSDELNLQTLISFLTLSYSPLDFLLTKKLTKQLTKKPGVKNKEWSTILECYQGIVSEKEEVTNNEKKLLELFKTASASKEEIKERKKLVSLFLTFKTPIDEGVKKGEEIIKYLKKWAKEKRKSQGFPELKEQFAYIEQFCEKFKNFDFKNQSTLKLEEMIKSFSEAKNFTNYYKQQNSVDVLDDVSLIAEPSNKEIFWLDFNADKIKKSNQFLLKEEIDFLSKHKSYNLPEKEINLQLKQWLNGIINCNNKLVLCVVQDTEKEKHPLHIRLESLFGKSTNRIIKEIEIPADFFNCFKVDKENLVKSKNITLPLVQNYLETDALKTIQKRKVESASSIEKFIEYPFDWVMQFVAKFSNNVGLKLPDDNLLKGNVAHKTIELILEKYPELDFEEVDIENVFRTVIEAEAAIFIQPEKRFELSEFKYRFFKSFNNLVQIIKRNNFTIKALEYEFGKEKDCIIGELLGNVNGYIDLYLKDSKGNPFIIDLKWSYSDKKYLKKIENNEAIQLAIYTAAIKKRDLANTGYFMLNQNKFITAVENLEGNNISVLDNHINNQEVLDKIKASLEFRWSEIKQGKLEIGDNFSLEKLQYYNEKGVISLPKDNKVKKAYPYSGYKLFKGMLK